MTSKSPHRSPFLDPHGVPDLEAIEAAVHALALRALWSDEARAELDELAEQSARRLAELRDCGLIRFVVVDGDLVVEFLGGVRH